MDAREIGVHKAHCCVKHGCKYGDDNCPVVVGKIVQNFPCWECDEDVLYEEHKELGTTENAMNYYEDPDFEIEAPAIEYIMTERRKSYGRERKAFLKGFIWACLLTALIHIGLAYALL